MNRRQRQRRHDAIMRTWVKDYEKKHQVTLPLNAVVNKNGEVYYLWKIEVPSPIMKTKTLYRFSKTNKPINEHAVARSCWEPFVLEESLSMVIEFHPEFQEPHFVEAHAVRGNDIDLSF